MKRWILKAGSTDLEGLVLEDVPTPEPGAGEVRIRIHAVSLNYRDQIVLSGEWGSRSNRDLVPISDGAGEIDAIGAGVTTWAVGDRVTGLYFAWLRGAPSSEYSFGLGAMNEDGMLAEYVVLPVDRVVRMPASLDYAESATLPCAALTAWNAINEDHPVQPDHKVLVLGSGGVSLFAMLFARAIGAEVIATSSQDAKLDRWRALGASDGINYRSTPDWGKAVLERTGGVDKVVDVVGTGTLNQSLTALRYRGEVVLIGLYQFDQGPLEFATLMRKNATVRGTSVGSAEMYEAMVQAIDQYKIQPPIDRRFRFEDAKQAYLAQSSPDLFGKIVIDVA
ncbi:zinc-dependent alcohol dehydrogenase family protein [Gloeobacter kilaueensis]|uniref:Alcohol dehydrogenase n=1 Tax=Gloeobacter kilaueensis (strain ATCC BAA-2537 / CCAP 1431/1 / ULC 316 / JS1) TaxID=1183438 RepID=U5QJ77_GLOK1|nr:NAD(P)-dependent alcohol dehydrogenase [Gloeobacter kilaueensis]AGY57679.1 alcohol dehydrogenase [Gloeobacter kilaueensis JS1]